MLYSDGSYEGELGEYVDCYGDPDSDFGIAPLLLAGALSIVKKIPVIGGLLGKGYDEKKWKDRVKRTQTAAAAGDLATLDLIASGYSGAWGSVYNPIRSAAKSAAASIRAAQKQAGQPVSAPAPLPPPSAIPTSQVDNPVLVPAIPPPGSSSPALPSPITQAVDQIAQTAGEGFRRGATPAVPSWVLPAVGAAAGIGLLAVVISRQSSRPN